MDLATELQELTLVSLMATVIGQTPSVYYGSQRRVDLRRVDLAIELQELTLVSLAATAIGQTLSVYYGSLRRVDVHM